GLRFRRSQSGDLEIFDPVLIRFHEVGFHANRHVEVGVDLEGKLHKSLHSHSLQQMRPDVRSDVRTLSDKTPVFRRSSPLLPGSVFAPCNRSFREPVPSPFGRLSSRFRPTNGKESGWRVKSSGLPDSFGIGAFCQQKNAFRGGFRGKTARHPGLCPLTARCRSPLTCPCLYPPPPRPRARSGRVSPTARLRPSARQLPPYPSRLHPPSPIHPGPRPEAIHEPRALRGPFTSCSARTGSAPLTLRHLRP